MMRTIVGEYGMHDAAILERLVDWGVQVRKEVVPLFWRSPMDLYASSKTW
jgi:hypothetical protein